MQVVMKVVGGKNDGREITISVPEFIIGRGESAHLRPSSDLISRKHCSIKLEDGQVIVSDMGSRNGTFVNGEQLAGPHIAKSGDLVRVGRLQFNLLIDPVKAGNKRPRVDGVVEAATRTAKAPKQKKASIEDSITDWLSDPDEDDTNRREFRNSETVQLNFEDTSKFSDSGEQATISADSSEEIEDGTEEESEEKPKKKKKFGKLPPRPKFSHDDSTSAAGDVLKKFFNRR